MPRRNKPFRLGVQDDDVLVRNMGPGREWGLDRARRLGVRVVRANFIYGDSYRDFDRLIRAARKRGMRVQLTLMGKPAYMRQGDRRIANDRANPREVGRWAGRVASHFRGRVKRYSVWNEPNHPWFLADTSPERYASLYKRSYSRIKNADPKARVMVGELAPTPDTRAFLRALARRRIKADGLAMHPYQSPEARPTGRYPESRSSYGISNVRGLQRDLRKLRGRMHTARGRPLPVYLTEFNYQADVPNRGSLLRSAIRQARRTGARQLILYQLARTPYKQWDTGLYEPDGTPTPASRSLAAQARRRRKSRR